MKNKIEYRETTPTPSSQIVGALETQPHLQSDMDETLPRQILTLN